MAAPIDILRIRTLTAGFALLPLAVLAAAPAVADPWLGDLNSGSASGSAAGATGDDTVGTELALAPPPRSRLPGTGSSVPQSVSTGSTEALGPTTALDIPPEANSVGLGDDLGLDSGSIQAACTGSAITGGVLIVLGSATGSWRSASALGSAALGSAITGSAMLTCLLLLPGEPLPYPYFPLPLTPPPGAPLFAAPPVEEPPTPPPPSVVPLPPAAAPPAEGYERPAVIPAPDPVAWNVLQLVTVMVVAVIAGARGRVAHARGRS